MAMKTTFYHCFDLNPVAATVISKLNFDWGVMTILISNPFGQATLSDDFDVDRLGAKVSYDFEPKCPPYFMM